MTADKTTYYVWKRSSDGFISASANGMPEQFVERADGITETFEQLFVCDDWNQAERYIKNARILDGQTDSQPEANASQDRWRALAPKL